MKQFLFRYAVAAGILCLVGLQEATAQAVRLMGMITDADTRTGLPAVTVWNKRSGVGSISNESGRYYIEALPGDTIEFSSISYVKTAYVAPGISATRHVEMKRHIMGLQGINIRGRIYKQDSLAIREEYERYFGYKRPGALDVLKTLPSNPITALTYLVPSKARKRREKFGEQLKYWEEEKHIDYRYNPDLVAKITKLESPELDSFMLAYRPPYNFLLNATEYDLLLFIKQSYERWEKQRGHLRKDSTE